MSKPRLKLGDKSLASFAKAITTTHKLPGKNEKKGFRKLASNVLPPVGLISRTENIEDVDPCWAGNGNKKLHLVQCAVVSNVSIAYNKVTELSEY